MMTRNSKLQLAVRIAEAYLEAQEPKGSFMDRVRSYKAETMTHGDISDFSYGQRDTPDYLSDTGSSKGRYEEEAQIDKDFEGEAKGKRHVKRNTREENKREVEISVSKKMDSTFGKWRGESPVTGNSVGYWTVKGWLYIPEGDRERAPLKEYALEVFTKFHQMLKKDQLWEIKEILSEPNMGLPKEVFDEDSFTPGFFSDVSEEDVQELAQAVREGFRIQGFNRGFLKKTLDKKTSKYLGRRLVSLPRMARRQLAEYNGDKETLAFLDSSPELKEATENMLSDMIEDHIVGKLEFGTSALKGAAFGLVTTASSTGALEGFRENIPELLAQANNPQAIGVAVGAVVLAGVMKCMISANRESRKGQGYDHLVGDIFNATLAPEDVEREYTKKLEGILNDEGKSNDHKQKSLLGLHKEFREEVLPRVEKGLFQRGEGEGSTFTDRFRRASESKKTKPVFLRLQSFVFAHEVNSNLEDYMKSKEGVKVINRILQGDIKLSKSMKKKLQSM